MSLPASPVLTKTQTAVAAQPADDMQLAALIASKICHDVIGPVGAITNGLEVLDDDDDEQSRTFAFEVIRNSAVSVSAKVQFLRFAFGAAGSVGSTVDLAMAEQIAREFIGAGRHKLVWKAPGGQCPKDRVRLLLNLVALALTAIPRGGDIVVSLRGRTDAPDIEVRTIGAGARLPQFLPAILANLDGYKVDALSVQAYYAARLARSLGLKLSVVTDGADVVLAAGH